MTAKFFAASAASLLFATVVHAADSGPIVIGVPVGLSGANSVVAPSVVQAAQLAVDEINANGGMLGRMLQLAVADDASGPPALRRPSTSLIFQKKVDAIISMETSAARNAGLPVVARGKSPFIYTSFYEGHSCSPYLYVDAWVPEQQVPSIVDYFGRRRARRPSSLPAATTPLAAACSISRANTRASGGKVIDEEYLPMDGADWTAACPRSMTPSPTR